MTDLFFFKFENLHYINICFDNNYQEISYYILYCEYS